MKHTSEYNQKGRRIIDVAHVQGCWQGGLGVDLGTFSTEELHAVYGRVDTQRVRDALNALKIGAIEADCLELCATLNLMRITEHGHSDLEAVFDELDDLQEYLPGASREILETKSAQQTLTNRAAISNLGFALGNLQRAIDKMRRARIWLRNKQNWHDDAFLIALTIILIAERSGSISRIKLKSADGPTTRFIAKMLALACVRKPTGSGEINADAVRRALEAHPLMSTLRRP